MKQAMKSKEIMGRLQKELEIIRNYTPANLRQSVCLLQKDMLLERDPDAEKSSESSIKKAKSVGEFG